MKLKWDLNKAFLWEKLVNIDRIVAVNICLGQFASKKWEIPFNIKIWDLSYLIFLFVSYIFIRNPDPHLPFPLIS